MLDLGSKGPVVEQVPSSNQGSARNNKTSNDSHMCVRAITQSVN